MQRKYKRFGSGSKLAGSWCSRAISYPFMGNVKILTQKSYIYISLCYLASLAHVVAEALLLFLTFTADPVIPYRLHSLCIAAASNYASCKQVCKKIANILKLLLLHEYYPPNIFITNCFFFR